MIYLLHAETPLVKSNGVEVQHYLGCCREDRLLERVKEHQSGRGRSKLTRAFYNKGIALNLVHTWPGGGYALEAYLKRNAHLDQHCPICRPEYLRQQQERSRQRRMRSRGRSAVPWQKLSRGTGGRWLPLNPGSPASNGGTSLLPVSQASTTASGSHGQARPSGGSVSPVAAPPGSRIGSRSAGTEQRSG